MPLEFITLLICECLLLVFAFFLIFSWLTKTPFYPSSVRKLNDAFEKLDVELPLGMKFVDIGSGDGRIVFWASDKAEFAEGIEYNPFLSMYSRMWNFIKRKKNVKFYNQDFRKHDFSKYNVAYMYIFPEHMEEIKDKLLKEMQPGSMIITNTFTIKGMEPVKKVDRFYLYKI